MFLRKMFLALAINVLIVSAASASSAHYTAGMAAYKRGDYKTAAAYLREAVRRQEASSATAHYYLADSLMRSKNVSQALQEYRRCLSLEPSEEMKDYCWRALRAFERGGGSSSWGSGSSYASSGSSSRQSESASVAAALHIDVSRLPRATPSRPISVPSVAEISNLSLFERANFFGQASNLFNIASSQLDEARSNFKKADSILVSAVPNARAFGESEAQFNARSQAAKSKVASLLQPFEDEVDRANAAFQRAQQILNLTIEAKNIVHH